MQSSDWNEVWSKVVTFIKIFSTVCRTPPTRKKIEAIHDFSFGYNLCFKCPNASCKLILDIYIPRAFQWYKKIHNPMGFDPYNRFLKIRKSIGTPTFKMGIHSRVWRFIPSHSPTLLGAWDVIPEFPFWLAPLQTFALVTSPRLGLQQVAWELHNIKLLWNISHSTINWIKYK